MTTATHPTPAMPPTDERMVPDSADQFTFWEHVYRYAFAARHAGGRRVLDIACGEGYGTAALRAAGAASVVGVDVSRASCDHARERYGIDARVGRAEAIPLPDGAVDLVVSYETVEHVPQPMAFLDECRRVLAPGGRLVMSTPNKGVYGYQGHGEANPYHCSEMTEAEFAAALTARFADVAYHTQRPAAAPWWSPRSMVAQRSWWVRVRGMGRVRRGLLTRLQPRAVEPPTPAQRDAVVDLIVALSNEPVGRLNPYAVRPAVDTRRERPTYLIATATRPH